MFFTLEDLIIWYFSNRGFGVFGCVGVCILRILGLKKKKKIKDNKEMKEWG